MKMQKNISIRIGIVLTLIALLSWLAFKQYQWLGEVSASQQKQLEESVKAAAANIAAEFDRNLSEIYTLFQVIHGDTKQDVALTIRERVQSVGNDHPYSTWVKSVYIFDTDEGEGYQVDIRNLNLIPLSKQETDFWNTQFFELKKLKFSQIQSLFMQNKTLFLEKERPFMLFTSSTIQKKELNSSAFFNFGINPQDFLSNNAPKTKFIRIVVELNRELLENKINVEWPQTYFGANANELYDWILSDKSNHIIFKSNPVSTETQSWADSADVTQQIGLLRGNTMVFVQTTNGNSTTKADSFSPKRRISSTEFSYSTSVQFEEKKILQKINPDSIITINLSSSKSLESKASADYVLAIRSKSGSLANFVEQTKVKNLSLSFGILGLLGISLVLIAWNSHRLQETAHQQMEFVAGVSHELKTPLAVIRSAAENVADGVVKNEDQVKKYGRLIQQEGQRLSSMVEQILEFSGIQSGNMPINLSVISVNELAAEMQPEIQELCEHAGFTLEWYESTALSMIRADKKYLIASILNLVTNAIKYSDKEKRIQMRWFATEMRHKKAIGITVQDFGMGISTKEQKLVFEPFFRGEQVRNDQIRGNGLGLHLVKRWIQAHNGTVELESRLGVGSSFTILIPEEKV